MSSIGENKDNISMDQTDEEAFRFAMTIAVGSVLPMVLKSAVDLNLLELIKKAGPNGSSASELAAQLPTNNPDAATMIKRILRLLAAHSILICNTGMLSGGDGTEPRYFLPAMCKFLTKNAEGVSLAPICMMIQDKILMESWYHLKDAVLEGGIPFNRAYGMSAFEYPAIDPRFNKVFNTAMSEQSNIFMKKIIEVYKGFEGVESLVDVGGGIGTTLCMIKLKYPSIKCINFDLPHVVQEAPPYPGVEHKGGDMFVSVPKADAIFMKWICHDWSDAHCQKLLKNCYEALPKNGKVIIAECMFPEDSCESKNHKNIQRVAISDVIMLAYNPGGKERSENEFHALAKGAGFTKFEKVCSAFSMWIMELHK